MPQKREFIDFCSDESCERQNVADGVVVRPFYLHSTCLAILEMEPGSVLPEHKHIHEQISYIVEGKVRVTVSAQERTVSKGKLYAVKSNTPHSCRALKSPVRMIIASSPLLRDYVFTEE